MKTLFQSFRNLIIVIHTSIDTWSWLNWWSGCCVVVPLCGQQNNIKLFQKLNSFNVLLVVKEIKVLHKKFYRPHRCKHLVLKLSEQKMWRWSRKRKLSFCTLSKCLKKIVVTHEQMINGNPLVDTCIRRTFTRGTYSVVKFYVTSCLYMTGFTKV